MSVVVAGRKKKIPTDTIRAVFSFSFVSHLDGQS